MSSMRIVSGAVTLLLVAACGAPDGDRVAGTEAGPTSTTETVAIAATTTSSPATTTSGPARSPLADLVSAVGSARDRPAPDPGAVPVTLTIESIEVVEATIVPVGVLADGAMEIPGASEVGWYRFGARPGEPGSAVLAAHVAFDGVPGVFRRLERLAEGDRFSVRFADAEVRHFEVTEVARYPKEALPRDRIFARGGDERIALVTCGGSFDPASRSFADNVVVYAVPAG